jgi:hypothetical protein
MNSEIIYNNINNLEIKVHNLYKTNQLKPSILDNFKEIESKIKDFIKLDPNNPIYNTYLKNLDLFKERTIIKLQKIDLEKQLEDAKYNNQNISSNKNYSIFSFYRPYTQYLIYLIAILIVTTILYYILEKL